MNERAFHAMGTEWYLRSDGCSSEALKQAQRRVEREEQRFSRFDPDSALSRLNRSRAVRDPVLAAVMRRALAFRQWTRGAFDPAVGSDLLAAGYDRDFEELRGLAAPQPSPGRPDIRVHGNAVQLWGEGTVDLGGIVKGWTVDQIARLLEDAGAKAYVIDGGGDIRVGAPAPGEREWAVGAGDGHILGLRSRAVATSSSRRRRWPHADGEAHHIISPATGEPAQGEYVTATVLAPDAMAADVLGTALIADAEAVLPVLPRFGAEALLQHAQGEWLMTPGLEGWLRP